MNRAVYRSALLMSAAFLFAANPVSAEDTAPTAPVLDKQQSANFLLSAARLGVTVFDSASKVSFEQPVTLTIEPQSGEQAKQEFEKLAGSYRAQMRNTAASAALFRDLADFAIDGATVVGTASGVGAIPTVFARAGAGWVRDKIVGNIQKEGTERARNYIATELGNWTQSQHTAFQEQVSNGNSEAALESFDDSTMLLTKIRSDLADDPQAQAIAEGYVLETLTNGTHEALQQAFDNSQDIDDLDEKFSGFAAEMSEFTKTTNSRLNNVTAELTNINKSLTDIQGNVENLAQSQFETQAQVAAMQEMLFSQAPVGQRIAMLEAGLVPNISEERKTDLLAVLKVERDKENLLRTASRISSDINNVAQIFGNLGVDAPLIAEAATYASVGEAALSSAMSGNYLGAVAAVSSLFAKKGPDPDQQRFEAIMGKLNIIEQKIDTVIDLQIQTLEAISDLSQQLADVDRRVNERFDRVDYQLKVLTRGVKNLMWAEYMPCNSAYIDRTQYTPVGPPKVWFDDQARTFVSLNARMQYSSVAQNNQNASLCHSRLANLFDSLLTTDVFGNPLSLEFAAGTDAGAFQLPVGSSPENANRTWKRDEIDLYFSEVYQPSISMLLSSWSYDAATLPNALALLGMPSTNVPELDRRLQLLANAETDGEPFVACDVSRTFLSNRQLHRACDGFDPSNEPLAFERTSALLSTAMVNDQLEEIANWVALSAEHEDIIDKDGSPIRTFLELENLPVTEAPGRKLISKFLFVLDFAIAQQVAVTGGMNTQFVYQAGWNKSENRPFRDDEVGADPKRQIAQKLLRNEDNPWLRSNVMMLTLDRAVRTDSQDPWYAYSLVMNALEEHEWESEEDGQARRNELQLESARNFLLEVFALAPETKVRTRTFEGVRQFELTWGDDYLVLPTAQSFRDREFTYPASLSELVGLRQQFAEKLANYDVFTQMPRNERVNAAGLIWSGLATK